MAGGIIGIKITLACSTWLSRGSKEKKEKKVQTDEFLLSTRHFKKTRGKKNEKKKREEKKNEKKKKKIFSWDCFFYIWKQKKKANVYRG